MRDGQGDHATSTRAAIRGTWQPLGQKVGNGLRRVRYRLTRRHRITINGVTLTFSTADPYSKSWFFPRYADGGWHEAPVTRLLLTALPDAQCFVDVGTNLGWFLCLASRFMPQGTVYGFEMDHLNYVLARQNLQLNRSGNVSLYECAVWDRSGQATYQRTTVTPGAEYVVALPVDGGAATGAPGVAVPTIALDEFFRTHGPPPDIVKIDVEGAEAQVLRGMQGLMHGTKPLVLLELHPAGLLGLDSSVQEVIALLLEAGYVVAELDAFRGQGDAVHLRALSRTSNPTDNTMVIASHPDRPAPIW
jgi:FkbM family methyltransferase